MPRRTLILIWLFLAASAIAQQPLPLANEELLHSARVWEARDRGDLAKLALEKLVAARPDSPAALLELGELALRMADIATAQSVQERLNARFAGSHEAKTFATELRFATRDRLQLASVQRLIQVNRGADARAELRRLFPEGAPDGALGIEYFRLLASTPGGWDAARDGLQRLATQHADDARYQFALARHLLRRDTTAAEGVRMLAALAQRDDIRLREVDDSLGNALKELGYRRAPLDALRSYSRRHPDDAAIRKILADRTQIEAEQNALLSDTRNAVDPERQRRNLVELQDALLAMPIAAVSADNAIALLRALRSDAPLGKTAFDEPTRVTLTWARRSRHSGMTDTALAATEKDVAVAFARRDYEAVIALVPRLEEKSSAADALDALETAGRMQHSSAWLFATRVRWLLDHDRNDEALQLLDARAIDGKWTAAERDKLRANALDRRAQRAIATGDTARAKQELERAVAAAPNYPWTRFRLAGLLEREGRRDEALHLMSEGVSRTPSNVEMRYAQALLFASVDESARALAVLETIPSAARSDAMHDLEARLRIAQARTQAQRLAAVGDTAAADRALLDAQAFAREDPELTRQLAAAWIDLDEPERGLALYEPILQGVRGHDTAVLLAWADLLNRADDPRLATVLEQLRGKELSSEETQRVAALEREVDLRAIRSLQREGNVTAAIDRVEALLTRSPDDRTLRILRADLELAAGNALAARDRYAALVGEQPDDLDTRLSYARALTDSGDVELARAQVALVAELAPADATELRLSLARRQLDLGDAAGASATLNALLASDPTRSDALLLAGRAELEQRDFVRAREFFTQAERSNDIGIGSEARLAREAIETRMLSWVEAGGELRHKPGDSGISKFNSWSVPTLWRYARDFEHRFTLRADAVSMTAGDLESDFDTAALFGTIQAAGAGAARTYRNERDDGLSIGLRYDTDTLAADIGTTPLGFLLTNVVGGIEWAPQWRELDVAFGLERRAVTSSVLSYGGMRDPITGRSWGGVVETGPYAEVGRYRETYSLSGSLRYTQLTGENVPDNTFIGVRGAADWKFFSRPQLRAFAGVTVNVWSYDKNLQNYTFGHGGYYSPESYVSIAIPVELQGTWRDLSFRVRASLSYSQSDIEPAAFYPHDPALQAAAANSPLPSGYAAPIYDDEGGSGTSLSAYAAVEKQLSPHFVVGAKLDIDRADYYEPTVFMIYLRHVFGRAATPLAIPPRPVRLYNE